MTNLLRFTRSLWLVLGMFVIFSLSFSFYIHSEKQIGLANESRLQAFLLADELRHSSDDLSNTVRSYVATGNPIYKQLYLEIIAIREGKSPRPLSYEDVYWDLVLADNRRPRAKSQSITLLELMQQIQQQVHFTAAEFAKLTQAKHNSDLLTRDEFAAMALIEATQPTTDDNRRKALALLFSPAYFQAKARIMQPIGKFNLMIEQRILKTVHSAESTATLMWILFIIFGLLLLLTLVLAYRALNAVLGGSVDQLQKCISHFGSGDFSCPNASKNSVLGWLLEKQVTLAHVEAERKQADEQLRAFYELDLVGLAITSPEKFWIRINQYLCDMIEYSEQELRLMTWAELTYPDDLAADVEQFERLLANEINGYTMEKRFISRTGKIIPTKLVIRCVRKPNSEVDYVMVMVEDITERKAAEEHINNLAFYDPLTQLANRRLLHMRIEHGIDINHRTGNLMAVLMMDLDKFKAVNDNFGHAAGDKLLQQVAIRIKSCVREVDTVARLGGDEFVILMESVKHYENVARVADDIIISLKQPFTLAEHYTVNIGVSIGIALYPQHGYTLETLIDNADTALYHAKESGRGCFAYFSDELTEKARERIELETRLSYAIEQNELQVYFQPQIDINSGCIIGAEALVRWHDPIHGFIMPSEFISLAEDTDLIVALGEFVLRETCRIGRQWLDQGLPAITLAVNVSPHQFSRSDINALVTQVLLDTGFPVEYLELEITESGLMDNQQHAMTILNSLHEQGVRFAIDDFGTGYSSLAYLKYFPVDLLKIDKTFIDDIPFLAGDMAITATIIAMAHHLGFKVLAEGVETAEQLAFLREHGCDMYQGYLHSKPMLEADFVQLLSSAGVKRLSK